MLACIRLFESRCDMMPDEFHPFEDEGPGHDCQTVGRCVGKWSISGTVICVCTYKVPTTRLALYDVRAAYQPEKDGISSTPPVESNLENRHIPFRGAEKMTRVVRANCLLCLFDPELLCGASISNPRTAVKATNVGGLLVPCFKRSFRACV